MEDSPCSKGKVKLQSRFYLRETVTFVELPLSRETTSGTDNTMAPSVGGKKTPTQISITVNSSFRTAYFFLCHRRFTHWSLQYQINQIVHMIKSKGGAYYKATKQLKKEK